VTPNATPYGDRVIGPNCSIGFGAVLVAESGPVRLLVHVLALRHEIHTPASARPRHSVQIAKCGAGNLITLSTRLR
jgi:hypothetical protein